MKMTSYADILDTLTMQPEKLNAYYNDFVPEEAWRVLLSLYREDVRDFIFSHSFILLKPETISRRLSGRVISYLAQRGFAPIAITCVEVTRNIAHHIWRFQWNAATTDRVELTNLVNAQSPSVLIMLRDCESTTAPASVKLWRLKGSAHAERRQNDQLRSELGMHNRMLGFVHTPDEPADFVRELSILFNSSALRALLRMCQLADQSFDCLVEKCLQAVVEIESRYTAHSVNPDEVIQRLSLSKEKNALSPILQSYSGGVPMSLECVFYHFRKYGLKRNSWDVLTIAAELIEHDKTGVSALLDTRAVDETFDLWDFKK
ncbi:nucleoside-diphosphate kinase [Serratia fonticola]|uniref:nucleoside-diphosphate kinase n=1 Tax=Serratia fonticola TaxID=47917 RepID=UPI003AACF962